MSDKIRDTATPAESSPVDEPTDSRRRQPSTKEAAVVAVGS